VEWSETHMYVTLYCDLEPLINKNNSSGHIILSFYLYTILARPVACVAPHMVVKLNITPQKF